MTAETRMWGADFWDSRYAGAGFRFGTDPSEFLTRNAHHLGEASNVLCVADGEGRNSVWLAGQGHRVTAFDASGVAMTKARGLAREAGVTVAYRHSGIEDWDWSRPYDAVIAIFVQFAPPALRDRFFGWMAQAVAPGGLLMLHGYAPRQVAYGTGGPGRQEHMYTETMLRDAFAGFDVRRFADYDAELHEGSGHSGQSALVDFIARKPVD
ncbi:class I SAM-dependent methyltransferase [Sedimentitalea sp. XS_ASV28]|uniref:class I SAM-dependent methyltransferase n=1 Tax=Sedimentitalea sp. XS_ASV28 TaxID=3241296 RepID=UPI003517CA26